MTEQTTIPKYSDLLLQAFDKVWLQSMNPGDVAAAAKAYADGVWAKWHELYGAPVTPIETPAAAAPGVAAAPAAPAIGAPAARVPDAPFGEAFLKGWDEPALRGVLAAVQGVVLCKNFGGNPDQLAETKAELEKSMDSLCEAQQLILLNRPPSAST